MIIPSLFIARPSWLRAFFVGEARMAEVRLLNGEIALIDDGDAHILGPLNWLMNARGYVTAHIARGQVAILHRLIMGADGGECVDHINGDKLDNRRQNLRICTHAENMRNRKMHKNNTTGVKGVGRDSRSIAKPFTACIRVNKKTIHLGRYPTAEDAGAVYQAAAVKYFGEFARQS